MAALATIAAAAFAWRGSLVVRFDRDLAIRPLPFRFLHEDLAHPSLERLRRQEGLEAVVAGAADRLDAAVRLSHWTHRQIGFGIPGEYPPWEANTILEWIRSGRTAGFCGQYAQVYAQACLSLGWRPRYVEIGPATNPIEHFSTEVWIDPLAKWVHLDPTHDVRFELEGRPLSSLEIHQALVGGAADRVVVRRGPAGAAVEGDERRRLLDFFYYVRFGFKMDHLSHPTPEFDRKLHWVDWNDEHTVPWESSAVPAPEAAPHMKTAGLDVDDPAIFDFPLGRVFVEAEGDRFRGRAAIRLTNDVPGFARYRWRRAGAEWADLEGDELEVEVGEGGVELEFVGVNERGVEGVPTRVELRWWP